ncbi:hypothetical protein LG047_06945 [Methylocystis sp. WRRC1]|uniref:hypothetical protein n=1 Tax=Methylocystis sp. WRRC1 TaxID=1732014 RepID=UPI001D14EA53|nr:hypothetical protein [Methylocystis sp. WRRC1]MCC3245058.1 hypothetical protein [Methylocystis sp. WRRC1]
MRNRNASGEETGSATKRKAANPSNPVSRALYITADRFLKAACAMSSKENSDEPKSETRAIPRGL